MKRSEWIDWMSGTSGAMRMKWNAMKWNSGSEAQAFKLREFPVTPWILISLHNLLFGSAGKHFNYKWSELVDYAAINFIILFYSACINSAIHSTQLNKWTQSGMMKRNEHSRSKASEVEWSGSKRGGWLPLLHLFCFAAANKRNAAGKHGIILNGAERNSIWLNKMKANWVEWRAECTAELSGLNGWRHPPLTQLNKFFSSCSRFDIFYVAPSNYFIKFMETKRTPIMERMEWVKWLEQRQLE